MSRTAYIGSSKRTFAQAFIHELETNYGLLKSRRVLDLMASDVQRLVEEFYPPADHLPAGWIVFTGTKATGPKAAPGQEACDQELVTLAWPLLTADDLAWMTTHPESQAHRTQLTVGRLIRLLEYGWAHPKGPVLLTLADLALLLGLTTVQASHLLELARQQSGKALLTKGYFFDQGLQPSHKAEIVALFEQGVDEADIARLSQHAPTSVGRYLRDYLHIKELCRSQIAPERIPALLDLRPSTVEAYLDLLRRFHPQLFVPDDSRHFAT